MKRTPLKRKTPLKQKAAKRKVKTPYKKAKEKAWAQFSLYIVTRDAVATTGDWTRCKCVTCKREFATRGKGRIQAGHWLGGRRGKNLFREETCFGQCFGCNTFGAGKQVEYSLFILNKYGKNKWEQFIYDANQPYKHTIEELEAIAESCKSRRLAITKEEE